MLKVEQFRCNEFAENSYVVYDEESLDAFIVDPGMKYENEWNTVNDYIQQKGLNIHYVLLTHYHIDHILGTGMCCKQYNVPICGSIEDQLGLPTPQMQAQMFGLGYDFPIAAINKDLKQGDELECGGINIKVIDCPGHSHHGLCYYLPEDNVLFSGDVLFFCSIGRSDFGASMGGDGLKLVTSIKNNLFVLSEETTVYPGHGPKTSIANEKKYNPYL